MFQSRQGHHPNHRHHAMNYQEFKRSYAPELREDMRRIGFENADNTKPTFWHAPHADTRLAWVVCFDFSARGNPWFNVMIGPYWQPMRLPSQEPFPRCVGYANRLCGSGIDTGNNAWQAHPGSFKRAVELLAQQGPAYFARYATPAALLAEKPAAQLAFDLADHAQACTLAERELASDYAHLYNIGALSPAGQRILRESLERGEALLRDSLAHLGRAGELPAIRARASLAAAHRTLADLAPILASQPNSRSLKSMVKACEAVIAAAGK
jgi:hypothetical protein